MYLDYYGFQEEPFNITPNSKFLYLSQRHREALASLLYGIEQRKGFIALTGEIGCGKTTICRAMLGKLDRSKVRLALILNPELSDLELLQTINAEYGLGASSSSKRELLAQLNAFLLNEYENDRNVVLLIDEAQRLSPQALEQVRLLSNLETESAKLIQIALIGQPELGDILDLPELEQLNQRITVRYHITALTLDEIADYIAHRIEVAQPRATVKFDKKAIKKIFEYSGGVPRRINVICDRALLVAYVREKTEITEEIVEKAIAEVGGPPRRGKGAKPQPASFTQAPAPSRRIAENSGEHATPLVAAVAEKSSGGAGSWPLAAALLIGFLAIAYAVMHSGKAEPEHTSGGLVAIARTATPSAIVHATPTPTPLPPPTPTPAPTTTTPSATPTETQVATATPEATTPEATMLAMATTAVETHAAETTAAPSASPAPETPAATTATPAPTTIAPTETPAPTTPEPTATEPPPTIASVTPAPRPVSPWMYDETAIMRVDDPQVTYPAAVLTWLALTKNEKLAEGELQTLRTMDRDQIAKKQLMTGRAPHFLREVRLPLNLAVLNRETLPAIVQTDDDSPGFGPWAVLTEVRGDRAVLYDPRGGKMEVDVEALDQHLAALVALFSDSDKLVGLRPLAQGDAVMALQKRLAAAGVYTGAPTGIFDAATEGAVRSYRDKMQVPGGAEIDAALAYRLMTAGGGAQ
ncbi:hypothetical protein BH09SUM1_BH09SUM1_18320 [soil metagenome]